MNNYESVDAVTHHWTSTKCFRYYNYNQKHPYLTVKKLGKKFQKAAQIAELTVNNEHQLIPGTCITCRSMYVINSATDLSNQPESPRTRSSSTHALTLLFPKSGMSSPLPFHLGKCLLTFRTHFIPPTSRKKLSLMCPLSPTTNC